QFLYSSRLALVLRRAARDQIPEWVREQLDRDDLQNVERLARLLDLYSEIDTRFARAGIPYLALKGITQHPLFGLELTEGAQYDIDLFCPQPGIRSAWDELTGWGYEPIAGLERLPTDHLPALVRKTGWEFHGDFFDPEMPFAVELHYQFWNPGLERLRAPG